MYPVHWRDNALAELATIWNAAPTSDNALLTWAISDLVFILQRDPENLGESRSHNTRIAFSHLLAVLFDVRDGAVWIHSVWHRA
jgi:hypothetical protein